MSFKEYLAKSNIQAFISVFVLVWCLWSLTFIKLENDVKLFYCTCIGLVLNFYLGSSRGSQIKDLNNK